MTSQSPDEKLARDDWPTSTIADAICDRLVHNAHVIALKGPSGREKKGLLIEFVLRYPISVMH